MAYVRFEGLDDTAGSKCVQAGGGLVKEENRGVCDDLHADARTFPLPTRYAAY